MAVASAGSIVGPTYCVLPETSPGRKPRAPHTDCSSLNTTLAQKTRMGCGASTPRPGLEDLRLPGANLTFSPGQLASLNGYLADLADTSNDFLKEPGAETCFVEIERLIQRLICGVGILDTRFSSKFLINLCPSRVGKKPDKSQCYLVRLDELSSPLLYPADGEGTSCTLSEPEGGPQGFGRLRISGPGAERWAEFIGDHGFLRRDRIQERFVELLAQSAVRSGLVPAPAELDESRLCGAPGKVVDPVHLHHILQEPPDRQVFYGAGESQSNSFPDPGEFRIAIVEGSSCVRLRIYMVHAASIDFETDFEVTLVLGVGFSSWPATAQFPSRISLSHSECLLYHQAASTGFYAVPAPPHPTLRCDDRTSAWQLRSPAAEFTLLKHHSQQSVPSRTLAALRSLVHQIRTTSSGGHVISDYMLKTLLWFRLEETPCLEDWTHDMLSTHVLVIADRLISALRTQRQSSYIFPWFNIMLNSPGSGTFHYTEEDYTHDAELLTYLVIRLSELSTPDLVGDGEPWRRLETVLVTRWSSLLTSLAPPPTTRGVRLAFKPLSSSGYSSVASSQYSMRQLNYIGQLLRSMLVVRSVTLTKSSTLPSCLGENDRLQSSGEDLVYLVSSILGQAKQASHKTTPFKKKSIIDPYDQAAALLLDEVRRGTGRMDSSNDTSVVREVLKWLYFGLDRWKKQFGPYLGPYLSALFKASHENSWFAIEWARRQCRDELEALGEFASLVVAGKISVNEGIVDAYNKGWSWAETMVKTGSQLAEGLQLVFTPSPGKVLRSSSDRQVLLLGLNKTLTRGKATLPRNLAPFKECVSRRLQGDGGEEAETVFFSTSHNILRNKSPMSAVVEEIHRYGSHRGLGSIVHTLISLKKLAILQEVCSLLPEEERARALEEIEAVRRRSGGRRAATVRASPSGQQSLMGTCRELRAKTGLPSVLNPAFFSAPEREAVSPLYNNVRRALTAEMAHVERNSKVWQRKKNDITTKL